MLHIWGRTNSVNVQKVLWCCHELGLDFTRTDAGMSFGHVDTEAYREMNPNGRVPTLVDGDYVLWESNAILRYLVLAYAPQSSIYPEDPKPRAAVERWLDWTLSTVQPAERPLFWGLVRTPPDQRDMAALQKAADQNAAVWRILDAHLDGRGFAEDERFTLADIALGTYVRRWFGVEGVIKPELANLAAWYARLASREGFELYVAPPLS